jgi:hypothetical protein
LAFRNVQRIALAVEVGDTIDTASVGLAAAKAQVPAARPFRWFTLLLPWTLAGYMFFDRAFAYLHLPGTPIFVGELVMVVGLYEAARCGVSMRALVARSMVLKLLLAFMALGTLRLLVDLTTYGLDAIRDAAIFYYGVFAFLVAAAAIADPGFISRFASFYRRLLPWFLLWAPAAIVLSKSEGGPLVPGSDIPINSFKSVNIAVNVGIATVFILLRLDGGGPPEQGGLIRRPWRNSDSVLMVMGVVALFVLGSQARGGFLGGLVALAVGVLALSNGERRRVALILGLAGGFLVGALLLFNVRIPNGEREISVRQVGLNLLSVLDPEAAGNEGSLQGNVAWRQFYWQRILADTTTNHAITGQGFGPILSIKYGIATSDDKEPPLRSAHNSYLTVLARMGFPGLLLWVLIWALVAATLARSYRARRHPRLLPLTRFNMWILAGVAGWLFDAFWDPGLESPVGGIWIWVLVGFGVASALTYKQLTTRPRAEPVDHPATAESLFRLERAPDRG